MVVQSRQRQFSVGPSAPDAHRHRRVRAAIRAAPRLLRWRIEEVVGACVTEGGLIAHRFRFSFAGGLEMSVIALESAILSMPRPHAVVDTSRPIALQQRTERTAVFHYSKVKDRSVKTKPHDMQDNHRAKRLRRFIAFILLSGALLTANPLTESARAQNAPAPPAPTATQPVAPPAAAAPTTPSAAPAPMVACDA